MKVCGDYSQLFLRQAAMQLHGARLELTDGVSQESIGFAFLLREGYVVLRFVWHVKSCVPEGDAFLQLGTLHDVRRSPKQGVVTDFIDCTQHITTHSLRLRERHSLVTQIEEQVPEHDFVSDYYARHIGYLGKAVVVAIIDM